MEINKKRGTYRVDGKMFMTLEEAEAYVKQFSATCEVVTEPLHAELEVVLDEVDLDEVDLDEEFV